MSTFANPVPVLEVNHLSVDLPVYGRRVQIVTDVSFRVKAGDAVALVGESGCGKTMTALSVIGLPPPGANTTGSVHLEGREVTALRQADRRRLCGSRIGFIFQEPMTSLHPTLSIGAQMCDTIQNHLHLDGKSARERASQLLDRVGIPRSRATLDMHVHELSGGMRQRVMIALAISCGPALVIADEPTTALDVTLQAQVLDLLAEMRKELGLAMLYITHDLEVVSDFCDRAVVMYAGDMVEQGSVEQILSHPRHPYTRGLIDSVLVLGQHGDRLPLIRGQVPPTGMWPPGCRFAPRCSRADHACENHPLMDTTTTSAYRCWHPIEE